MKAIPREVKIVTNSRHIRQLRDGLSLSSLQQKVLIGSLLGDGCLSPNEYGKNYRLQMVQGNDQKEYLWWKYEIFKNWTLSEPKFVSVNNSWRFRTLSHPELTKWQQKFYIGRKKILPKDVELMLDNPLSLAIWFMDDGGKMKDKYREYGNLFNVQGLSLDEVIRLQKVLMENFSLSTTRQWNNRGYRLYIGKSGYGKLNELIEKFVHPTLKYKLILTP